MIFVVGTGRCGTRWITERFRAEGLEAEHESNADTVVPLAPLLLSGAWTAEQVADTLNIRCEWAEVEVGYTLTPLLPVLAWMYPEARFLWLWREPEATVASMMRDGWYLPSDDGRWPFSLWGLHLWDDTPALWLEVAMKAMRVTAPIARQMWWRDWQPLSQEARCRWWWWWANEWCATFSPVGRSAAVAVEHAEEVWPQLMAWVKSTNP